MNKNILILAVCAICFGLTASAQVDIITFNDLNYVDNSDRINFRTPSAGDMAIVVNTTINNSLSFDDRTVDLLAQDFNGTNRLAEQLIPSYRYYLTSRRCVSAGLLLGREAQIITGNALGVDSNAVSSMVAQNKSRSLSFRVAFDQHNKPWRFRRFDLDTYFGAALSIGRTKAVEYTDIQYTDGSYLTQTATTPGTASGGELYTGIALRFDRVSVGVELLGIGFDRQGGFGISEVEFDQFLGGERGSGTYYTASSELTTEFQDIPRYESLTAKSSRLSMYKGARFNLVLHL